MALYQHLLTAGRRKRDTNWEMFQLWQDAQVSKREIRTREIADKVAVAEDRAERSHHVEYCQTTAVVWQYVARSPVAGAKPPSVPRRPHKTWTPERL